MYILYIWLRALAVAVLIYYSDNVLKEDALITFVVTANW